MQKKKTSPMRRLFQQPAKGRVASSDVFIAEIRP
jgi:hypothetical protein